MQTAAGADNFKVEEGDAPRTPPTAEAGAPDAERGRRRPAAARRTRPSAEDGGARGARPP